MGPDLRPWESLSLEAQSLVSCGWVVEAASMTFQLPVMVGGREGCCLQTTLGMACLSC